MGAKYCGVPRAANEECIPTRFADLGRVVTRGPFGRQPQKGNVATAFAAAVGEQVAELLRGDEAATAGDAGPAADTARRAAAGAAVAGRRRTAGSRAAQVGATSARPPRVARDECKMKGRKDGRHDGINK